MLREARRSVKDIGASSQVRNDLFTSHPPEGTPGPSDMTSPAMWYEARMGTRWSAQGVARACARTQLLSGGWVRSVEDVVGTIVGGQAQDETAASLAIRARSRGLVAADMLDALIDTRSLVLTWSLRGTRHIHRVEACDGS